MIKFFFVDVDKHSQQAAIQKYTNALNSSSASSASVAAAFQRTSTLPKNVNSLANADEASFLNIGKSKSCFYKHL